MGKFQLLTTLTLDSAGYNRELEKTKGNNSKFKKSVEESNSSLSQLGGMLKGAALGLFAGGIAATAMEVGKFGLKIDNLTSSIKKMSGENGILSNTLSGVAQGISSTYDVEVNEVLRSANALTKQMGISFEESMSLIQRGFANGANDSGDFLESIREYSTQFQSAGYSAEEFVAIIANGAKQGVFSDKSVDTIKEGALRLREMTTATRDALGAIGLSADSLQAGIANGTITMRQAINIVSERISQLQPESKLVGQALADIFGGAGEDAGYQFVAGIHQIPSKMGEIVDEVSQQNDRLVNASAKMGSVFSTIFSGMGEGWRNFKVYFFEWGAESVKFLDKVLKSLNEIIAIFAMEGSFSNFGSIWGQDYGDNNIGKANNKPKDVGYNGLTTPAITPASLVGDMTNPFNMKQVGAVAGQNFVETFKETVKPSLSNIGNYVGADAKKTKGNTNKSVNTSTIGQIAKVDVDSDIKSASNALEGIDFEPVDIKPISADTIESYRLASSGMALMSNASAILSQNYDESSAKSMQFAASTFAIQTAFQGLNATLSAGAESFSDFAKSLAGSVRSIIGALIGESVAMAVTNAISSLAKTPYGFLLIPAVAALASGLAKTAFNSLVPKFENGGIVGGSSFSGDNITARVNSGEMILNRSQQANLFDMINKGFGGGGQQVEFKIQGDTLVGIMGKMNKINGFR